VPDRYEQRDRQARAAQNQLLFREVNEQVGQVHAQFALVDDFGPSAPPQTWVCECTNEACLERIEMSVEEYRRVRSSSARFVVAPGDEHFTPGVERVVEKQPRFWVVAKLDVD
jgi:hypothetical protein